MSHLTLTDRGSPVANGDGTYTISYQITVSNTSTVDAAYDLDDSVRFGDGIAVVSATITATTPAGIAVNASWDGGATTRIVTGRALAAGDSEVYTIEVVASAGISLAAGAGDCELGAGETGTGFLNTASVSFNGQTGTDDACAPAPSLTIDKHVVGTPTRHSDNTYTVIYDVVVSNVGEVDTTYDLDDHLQFGAGITITSATVANVSPGGIATNPGWNGVSVQQIVNGQSIAADAVHIYEVTVITGPVAYTVTSATRDCELELSEIGTGFLNSADLSSNGLTISDNACAVVPPTTPPIVSPPKIPKTGTDAMRLLNLATALLLLGLLALALAARRRRYTH